MSRVNFDDITGKWKKVNTVMTLIRAALILEPPSNKSRTIDPLVFNKSRTQLRAALK